jgi:O-acetyl-ADP-ribose deacetylase (regulator of RNase III)
MIRTRRGDLLSVTDGIIVHGCNALGLMGAGVAALIRVRWPQVYSDYRQQHAGSGLQLGDVIFTHVSPRLTVASAITQSRLRRFKGERVADLDAIEICFRQVAQLAAVQGRAVHFPAVGAGLAGGDWKEIEPRIARALGDIDGTLWVLI